MSKVKGNGTAMARRMRQLALLYHSPSRTCFFSHPKWNRDVPDIPDTFYLSHLALHLTRPTSTHWIKPSKYGKMNESECYHSTTLEIISSPTIQVFFIVIYSAVSLLSLIGNIIVLIVQFYGKESARNIRKYLINLAISDVIIGVLCVPITYTRLGVKYTFLISQI